MGNPSGGLGMQPQQPGEYASGTIASIQNDQDGTPTWLLSGAWQGAIINVDEQQSEVYKSFLLLLLMAIVIRVFQVLYLRQILIWLC